MLYRRLAPFTANRPTAGGGPPALRLAVLALLLAAAMAAAGLLGAPNPGEASSHWTDYDTDDDNLIEIRNLAQLHAIHRDRDGNGSPEAGVQAYLAAFPNRKTAAPNINGCASTCAGYELMVDLDFDTNGNGMADSGDSYWNSGAGWDPIERNNLPYNTTFEGNGHVISNLFISRATQTNGTQDSFGLFGQAGSGAAIRNVGIKDANVTADDVGGILVGNNAGTVSASWTSGTISGDENISGLAGVNSGTITASYSTAAVTGSSTDATNNRHSGGLVGQNASAGTVTASYFAGTLSNTIATNPLVGINQGTITSSYWDTTVSMVADDADNNAPEGRSTAQLQAPTDYGASTTDIFPSASWNANVDGVSGNDDPWHFGGRTEYPILKHERNYFGLTAQQTGVDYDTDDDNLIEISSLAQLNAIRYDLDSNGTDAARDDAALPAAAAFPGLGAGTDCAPGCAGFELMANLDFDTNGSGGTHTAGVGDTGDTYCNPVSSTDSTCQGWLPIGGHSRTAFQSFTGTLEGNDHTISNLYINQSTSGDDDGFYAGLFGTFTGAIRNVGLVNPYVRNTRTGGRPAASLEMTTGALAGRNNLDQSTTTAAGTVSGSYVSGGSVASHQGNITGISAITSTVGCLLGDVRGVTNTNVYVSDSWATCNASVTGDDAETNHRVGGLLGDLVRATVSDSWAAGNVSTSGPAAPITTAGGLIGDASTNSHIIRSHATGNVGSSNISQAGGLIGYIFGGSVTQSFATGAVTASENAGGLISTSNAAVTASFATGAVTASSAATITSTTHDTLAGGLFGLMANSGTATASFATGPVTSEGDGAGIKHAGGLAGLVRSATITASYAAGAVSATGSAGAKNAGGLMGAVSASATPTITASYATGAVSATGAGAATNRPGGLLGGAVTTGTITNSYWDTQTTGQTTSVDSPNTDGKTTTQLQTPTEYGSTGIYMSWNVNLDGMAGNDDPWHFGTASDYPILKYNMQAVGLSRQIAPAPSMNVDYDADGDGLIAVATLAQLDAIRYDLDANGLVGSTDADAALAYARAFPAMTARMGCPIACAGYELLANLDFDTGAPDDRTDDEFAGANNYGWAPIIQGTGTGYSGIFEGNGHTIANLYINLPQSTTTTLSNIGLFGELELGGEIRGVGVVDASVFRAWNLGGISAGALVGQNSGTITDSYATGAISASDPAASASSVGGLVGQNNLRGKVNASYAAATATVTTTANSPNRAGGLVGYNFGTINASYATGAASASGVAGSTDVAGGLVGANTGSGTITASYATGSPTTNAAGSNFLGGLAGTSYGTITNSYWDTATAGAQVTAGVGAGTSTGAVGYTTAALRGPTGYDGIYADWNVDLDGDGRVDNPWRFGNDTQYPVLHFSRPDADADFRDYDLDDDGLIEIRDVDQLNAVRYDLDGDGSSGSPVYDAAFPNRDPVAPNAMGCIAVCRGYELADNLDFDTDGDEATYTVAAGVVTGDADDDYCNPVSSTDPTCQGWAPIGGHGYNAGTAIRSRPYTAILEGNGYTIANLYLNLDTTTDTAGYFVGLFGSIAGPVRNVGLVNPYVHNERTGNSLPVGGTGDMNTGVLAGTLAGGSAVRGSYVSGGSVAGVRAADPRRAIRNNVGCLLGDNRGAVSSSWASCDATVGGTATSNITYYVGGLVGQLRGTGALVRDSYTAGNVAIDTTGSNPAINGNAGGLVGNMASNTRVDRSYATGSVSSDYRGTLGGLVGFINGTSGNLATVSESFATGAVTGSSVGSSNDFDAGGLVGRASFGNVTASYASGAVSANTDNSEAGGLAGTLRNGSTITASYATGAVSAAGDNVEVGGLVGEMTGTTSTIRASYATGAVSATGDGANDLGGLVGNVTATTHAITASYATGAVSATGTGTNNIGGLVGGATNNPTVMNSYWDSQTSNQAASPRGGTAQTTAALQGPTEYGSTGIYMNWNLNLDGMAGNDDPWHFGDATQYPILQYRQDALGLARQRAPLPEAVNYDTDGDNLLEVATLTHLDAIRYDLDGNGVSARTPAAARAYLAAFPGISAGMGCAGICRGYELAADADLDFDSDGDGAADGDYANWNPIGSAAAPYAGVFRGNGRPIANLAITGTAEAPTEATEAGLFGAVSGDNALIEGVALTGVSLTPAYSSATLTIHNVGALVGQLGSTATGEGSGVVRTSYAVGEISVTASGDGPVVTAGGLVGRVGANAAIIASYAGVGVTVDNPDSTEIVADRAAGLVGVANGSITAAYATGAPAVAETSRAGAVRGGLAGSAGENASISASYWDVESGGIADDDDDNPPEGKTTAELSTPTDYDGIYETWDDASLDSDPEADAPWDFGDACQYPVLSFGGHTAAAQRVNDAACPPSAGGETGGDGGEQEYVAPPIVYNLNIRFSVRRIDLDEGQSASYRVRLSEPPAGHAYRVSVSSDNPDVMPAPATLTFSASDWNEWQTVKITVARDANRSDESATVSHRGPGLSYGSILVAVNDTWPGSTSATVNGHTVTMRHTLDAPAGVTVTAPDTLDTDLDITIGGPPSDAPDGAPGYGIGQTPAARMLASIRVAGTPADGLSVCLPLAAALVDEAEALADEGEEPPLTLLRYADGRWSPVADSERRDSGDGIGTELLCAAGVTEYGVFATAYTLPELGRVLNLTAAPGAEPGTLTLTWTPGANAVIHWIAGVKQTDPYNLAIWGPAAELGSHTFTGLDSGSPYILTVTAGRGESDGSQWTAWAPWVYATPD